MTVLGEAAGGAEQDFSSFYDRTIATAFGLALRITEDPGRAEAACEAAYSASWRVGGITDAALLARVREEAISLARRVPPQPRSASDQIAYTPMIDALRAGLEAMEPSTRRAIELAYFGGLQVDEVAEMLGIPAAPLRTAMRTALLQLGALSYEQETRR